MKRILGALYILISLTLLSYGGWLILERTRPISTGIPYLNAASSPDIMFTIKIPSASIELPAFSAVIHDATWQTTKRGVSYLSTSPLPGEQGNSVLYGHNWPNLLGNLHKVKPGDVIFVTRANKTSRFTVRYVAVVHANEYSVYQATTDTRITLYTCTGFLDRDRLVVTAFPDIL